MKVFIILLVVFVIIILGITLMGWFFSAPAYIGPVSDHFDGKKFINPGAVKAGGFKDVMKWMSKRDRGEWTEMKAAGYGAVPVAKVEGDTIVVTFVNHSTFLIQMQGLNILTDPVWSERASPVTFAGPRRMRPPGIRLEDLPEIDIILLTHNHYDHLDINTLAILAERFNPEIFTPLGVGKYLEDRNIVSVTEMDWWDEATSQTGLKVICTPAQHFSGRGMFDRDRTLWSGFAIETENGNIYYAGDTGFGDFFNEISDRLAPVRMAFLPIGAYKPQWFMSPIHTSPADAVKFHKILNSPYSIGMHFGTFPLADDGMADPENDLRTAMEKEGVDSASFIVPEEGEKIQIN